MYYGDEVRIMETFVVLFIFFCIFEALLMEWIKKHLLGDGEKVTASKWVIWIIAFSISLVFSIALCCSESLTFGMGWFALVPYTLGMYSIQFVLSMSVIKALVKIILKKFFR